MMELSIILGMFALPVAAIGILVIVIVGDIKSQKRMKHFEAAMHKCIKVRGWEFTHKLMDRCSKAQLPVDNRIELLEHFIQAN